MTAADILFWFVKLWAFWSAVPVVAFLVYQRHKIQAAFDDYPTGYLLSPPNAPSTISQKAYSSPLSDSVYRYKRGNDWYYVPKEPDLDPLAEQIIQAAADMPFVYIEID